MRTVAALLLLLRWGHTRIAGDRRRVVLKAATWLAGRPEPLAAAALAQLTKVEAGNALDTMGFPSLGTSAEAEAVRGEP